MLGARKAVNRAWNAFFYAFGAVAAPYQVTEDRLEEIAVSRQISDCCTQWVQMAPSLVPSDI